MRIGPLLRAALNGIVGREIRNRKRSLPAWISVYGPAPDTIEQQDASPRQKGVSAFLDAIYLTRMG